MANCPAAYPSPPGISSSLTGFRLCGAASGTVQYQSEHFDKKLREARELSEAVEEYGDPQGAHLLMRFCVLPKLIYLTRVMGDVITSDEWSCADKKLGESWARIMGLSEQEWGQGEVQNQAYLPQYQGGLGLTCFRTTATAGLLGSCGVTLSDVVQRLTDQAFLGQGQAPEREAFSALPWLQASKREFKRAEAAVESVKLKANYPLRHGWNSMFDVWWRASSGQEQQKITDAIHRSCRVYLFSKVQLSEQVRLHSCSGNGASARLSAIPSSGWLRFPPVVYRVAIRIRLGLGIPEMRRAGVCVCGSPLNPRGHHTQKCPNGEGVHWRHEQVKRAFTQILRRLRHTHVLEETTLGHLGVATDSHLADQRNKRADIFASLSNSDTILADVSITFPISSDAARLRTRSKTAGAAAKTKSEEKQRKYVVAARSVGLRFIPLVFETFGRPDRETVSFVKELVGIAGSKAGFSTEGEMRAVQRVSQTGIGRSSVVCCSGCFPFFVEENPEDSRLPAVVQPWKLLELADVISSSQGGDVEVVVLARQRENHPGLGGSSLLSFHQIRFGASGVSSVQKTDAILEGFNVLKSETPFNRVTCCQQSRYVCVWSERAVAVLHLPAVSSDEEDDAPALRVIPTELGTNSLGAQSNERARHEGLEVRSVQWHPFSSEHLAILASAPPTSRHEGRKSFLFLVNVAESVNRAELEIVIEHETGDSPRSFTFGGPSSQDFWLNFCIFLAFERSATVKAVWPVVPHTCTVPERLREKGRGVFLACKKEETDPYTLSWLENFLAPQNWQSRVPSPEGVGARIQLRYKSRFMPAVVDVAVDAPPFDGPNLFERRPGRTEGLVAMAETQSAQPSRCVSVSSLGGENAPVLGLARSDGRVSLLILGELPLPPLQRKTPSASSVSSSAPSAFVAETVSCEWEEEGEALESPAESGGAARVLQISAVPAGGPGEALVCGTKGAWVISIPWLSALDGTEEGEDGQMDALGGQALAASVRGALLLSPVDNRVRLGGVFWMPPWNEGGCVSPIFLTHTNEEEGKGMVAKVSVREVNSLGGKDGDRVGGGRRPFIDVGAESIRGTTEELNERWVAHFHELFKTDFGRRAFAEARAKLGDLAKGTVEEEEEFQSKFQEALNLWGQKCLPVLNSRLQLIKEHAKLVPSLTEKYAGADSPFNRLDLELNQLEAKTKETTRKWQEAQANQAELMKRASDLFVQIQRLTLDAVTRRGLETALPTGHMVLLETRQKLRLLASEAGKKGQSEAE
eukprot:Cvel_17486.t1-p1 / transcript=Cvel_17486.t1 / gene=Cvel_17486 / organism=Chromera_velia_CCMP2878 / gene_product=hypothetical protein / transcript_product=hypothetical protein / location=Cvel_scaffold1400:445-8529(-) / protein_length=1259 / sequence_SO=supercontig / SO=protein_coding / is_pseudo=false